METTPAVGSYILLVDDAEDVRDTLTMMLEEEGYAVVALANGSQALDYLDGGPLPGLIVLDLMTPVMTGWELAGILQRDPVLAGVPTIVVTAVQDAGRYGDLLQAREILVKPVEPRRMLESVARHFRRDGAAAPAHASLN
jgi:CheY-like chemotaxis protein